jgi:hypothetical protein
MRLFNNSKNKQSSKQAGLLEGEQADGTISNTQPASVDDSNDGSKANSTGVGGSSSGIGQPISMDWDKIYVEIDNDANGTVGHAPSGSSSTLVSENTFESKSYTIMEDDDDGSDDRSDDGSDEYHRTSSTPRLSNMNSGTVGSSRGDFTRGQSGSTDGDGGEDGTLMVPTMEEQDDHYDEREMTADDFSITKNGKYLSNNHFANAQLMRWKHASEEGPAIIQVLAFLAALAALTSTLYPLVTDDGFWTIPTGICALHSTALCLLIIVFEVRAWGHRNPMSLRARIRNLLVRYLNVLRLVWGRGFLYIFAGTMNITVFFLPYVYYTGCTLIGLGLLAILTGAHASFNLERLRLSLTDNSFLWSKFVEADTDKDTLIGISEFSNLVWSLGLELDDAYTYRAFSEIDQDADSKISFYEFKAWWIASQDGDETVIITVPSRRVPNHISV